MFSRSGGLAEPPIVRRRASTTPLDLLDGHCRTLLRFRGPTSGPEDELNKLHIVWVLSVLLLTACVGAPVQQMSDARQAIAAAEEAGANERSPDLMQDARDFLESAEAKLLRHSYRGARQDAESAREKAREAMKSAAPQDKT